MNKDIRMLETYLADMLESQQEFAARVDAIHVRKTTIALAYTVSELGGVRERDFTRGS